MQKRNAAKNGDYCLFSIVNSADLPPEQKRTGEANHSKYKTIFPLSQLPKSVVAVTRRCFS
ncbi:hypothetical protein EM308_10445 [Flavobacterium gilvum]|uniref:Uncharacterized protein n=1 Tax=Flavobacterium gilvum TaxID=1492737 RepID=A0AAC9I5C3_9FLAO|nr:hypothetical protein EM308_10445 [Flavobacterium gilvum]